jgi:hypothetical protein
MPIFGPPACETDHDADHHQFDKCVIRETGTQGRAKHHAAVRARNRCRAAKRSIGDYKIVQRDTGGGLLERGGKTMYRATGAHVDVPLEVVQI